MNIGNLPIDETIWNDSQLLSQQLQALQERLFPPEANKVLRNFTSSETAKLIGITDSYIRQLAKQEDGLIPKKTQNGRRSFSLEDVHLIKNKDPIRNNVTNFKYFILYFI